MSKSLSTSESKPTMGMSFLMRGKVSVAAAQQAKVENESRKDQFGKMWRFWLEPGEEASLIFMDGVLGDQGMLEPPRWYEHNLFLNGKWGNLFVCPHKTQPDKEPTCCICESKGKGSWPTLQSVFGVIDTRMFTPSAGGAPRMKGRRLYVCNPTGFDLINAYARKRGGLAGWKVDVTRSSKDAPRTGDVFDFIEQKSAEEWGALYREDVLDEKTGKPTGKTKSMFYLPNYDDELSYKSDEKLRQLGFGPQVVATPTGFTPPSPDVPTSPQSIADKPTPEQMTPADAPEDSEGEYANLM